VAPQKEKSTTWEKFSVFSSYFYSLVSPNRLNSDKFFHTVYCTAWLPTYKKWSAKRQNTPGILNPTVTTDAFGEKEKKKPSVEHSEKINLYKKYL